MSLLGELVKNEFVKKDDDWMIEVFVKNDDVDEIIRLTYDWSVIGYEAAYSLVIEGSDEKAIHALKVKGLEEKNIQMALEQARKLITEQSELFEKVIFHENEYADELDEFQSDWRVLSFTGKVDLIHRHQKHLEELLEKKEEKPWWKNW